MVGWSLQDLLQLLLGDTAQVVVHRVQRWWEVVLAVPAVVQRLAVKRATRLLSLIWSRLWRLVVQG